MFSNRTATRSPQELAGDFNQLIEQGKALLGQLMETPEERSISVRDVLNDVGERFAGFQTSAGKAAQRGARQGAKYARRADRYIHDNPWPTMIGGIIVGVLATLWLSQRR